MLIETFADVTNHPVTDSRQQSSPRHDAGRPSQVSSTSLLAFTGRVLTRTSVGREANPSCHMTKPALSLFHCFLPSVCLAIASKKKDGGAGNQNCTAGGKVLPPKKGRRSPFWSEGHWANSPIAGAYWSSKTPPVAQPRGTTGMPHQTPKRLCQIRKTTLNNVVNTINPPLSPFVQQMSSLHCSLSVASSLLEGCLLVQARWVLSCLVYIVSCMR